MLMEIFNPRVLYLSQPSPAKSKVTIISFYKNPVYKIVEAQNGWNLKNILEAQFTKSFHLFLRCNIEAQNLKFSNIFGNILTIFLQKLEHYKKILYKFMKIKKYRTFEAHLEEKLITCKNAENVNYKNIWGSTSFY